MFNIVNTKTNLQGEWRCRELNPIGVGYQSSLANLPSPLQIHSLKFPAIKSNVSRTQLDSSFCSHRTGQAKFIPLNSKAYSIGIDDVRIYNYSLTEQQIRTLYNDGAVIGGWKIKVIVKKIGNGKPFFWSVIPNWITSKKRDKGKRYVNFTGNLEED